MARHFRNLVELGETSARRFADRPLFGTKSEAGWSWIRYAAFQELVDALRGGLATLGVRPGDRVAIVSNNRVEWAVAAYATYGLGATFVPMYEAQRPEEWELILRDCGAVVVLASGAHALAALDGMRARLPELAHVVGIDAGQDGAPTFSSLLARGREKPKPSVSPEPSEVAALIYTSGTTGRPKGVMLTHDNFTSNIRAVTSVFPVTSDDRTLSFLPWAHVYGQVVELHIIVSVGASTAFNSEVARLTDELAEVQPTMLIAVPRIFNRLYEGLMRELSRKPKFVQSVVASALRAASKRRRGEHVGPGLALGQALADRLVFAKVRAKLGGRLAYAISGSAALSLEVAELIDALGVQVYEGYGLTETSPIVSANYPGSRKLGSAGKPVPGVTVRIDPTVGVEPGRGEIVVYGPNVMKGYFGLPEETAKVLKDDGGLRTGDEGYVDDDGFLFVTGRIKDQYKLENGKYVAPSPLEDELKLSPYISNLMLYGANQPFNVAVVVLDEPAVRAWARDQGRTLSGDLTTDPAVTTLIRQELAARGASFRGYERPRAFVLTLEDFTIDNALLTPTLKVKRRAVYARYQSKLAALYEAVPESAARL